MGEEPQGSDLAASLARPSLQAKPQKSALKTAGGVSAPQASGRRQPDDGGMPRSVDQLLSSTAPPADVASCKTADDSSSGKSLEKLEV